VSFWIIESINWMILIRGLSAILAGSALTAKHFSDFINVRVDEELMHTNLQSGRNERISGTSWEINSVFPTPLGPISTTTLNLQLMKSFETCLICSRRLTPQKLVIGSCIPNVMDPFFSMIFWHSEGSRSFSGYITMFLFGNVELRHSESSKTS